MPQFPPRKLRPMRPEHYRRITLRMREMICRIEQGSDPQTPHERKALTQAVFGLYRSSRELMHRHEAQNPDIYEVLPGPPDAA